MPDQAQQSVEQPPFTVLPPPGTTPILNTTPSIIAINPQISTTLVWVGVGVAIGLVAAHYLMKPRRVSN